ncbi:MAG TPA: hypothetical protein VF530_17525 [Planctomycetota bacterium]
MGLTSVGGLVLATAPASAQQVERVNAPLAHATVGDVTQIRFTPDSAQVVYRADQEQDELFRLYAVASTGGPERALGARPVAGGAVLDFDLAGDARTVVYRGDLEVNDVLELFACPLSGRAPGVKLSGALVPGGDVTRFAVAARGRRVVYLADQDVDERFELYTVPLAGGPPVRLSGPLVAGGDVARFEIAPDGRQVVFTADASVDGVLELFQVPIEGGPRVLLGTGVLPGVDDFAVAPDSKRVVFNTDRLRSVPLIGGPAQELFGASARFQLTPDASRVLFVPHALANRQLHSVPIRGGLARRLTDHGFSRVHSFQISPDSRRVAYHLDAGDSIVGLYSVSVKGGPVAVLDDGTLGSENVFVFTPDSRHLLYSPQVSQATGTLVTYLIPSAGGTPVRLTDLAIGALRATPDSTRALCIDDFRNLYSVPLDGGAEAQISSPSNAGGGVADVVLSPDGARVAFRAEQDEDRVFELFSVPVAGGPIVALNGALAKGPVAGDVQGAWFSPDGAHVVYRADQDTDEVFELYSAPSAGGPPVKLSAPFVRGGDVELFGVQISPDSQWVVYIADAEVAWIRELYAVPITGGPVVELNAARGRAVGTIRFKISPDSSRVVYENDVDGNRLFSVPIGGGPSTEFVDGFVGGSQGWLEISPDSTRVVYATDAPADGIGLVVHGAPLAGGLAIPLHALPAAGGGAGSFIRILPDSSGVVYQADLDAGGRLELYLSPLDATASTKLSGPLVAGGAVTGLFVPSPDSARVAFLADAEVDGRQELYSVSLADLARTKLNPPLVPGGNVSWLAVSPASAHVVYAADQRQDGVVELFRVPIAGGTASALHAPPVTGGDVDSTSFLVSSDSAHVVFRGDLAVNDVFELYSAPLAGGPSVTLSGPLPPGGDVSAEYLGFQLHADGSRVVYMAEQRADELVELYAVPIAGGTRTRLNPPLVANGDVGSDSPYFVSVQLAGDQVLYHADQDQDGVVEVYRTVLAPARR